VDIVRRQRRQRWFISLSHLDLNRERIGFHINAPGTGKMFLAKFLRSGDIEKGIGLTIKLEQPFLGHAVAAAAGVVAPKPPLALKPMGVENRSDRRDVVVGLGRELIAVRVIDPSSGVLHIIHIVTQVPQADQIMEKLIGHSCQRIPENDPKNDHLALRGAFASRHRAGFLLPELLLFIW